MTSHGHGPGPSWLCPAGGRATTGWRKCISVGTDLARLTRNKKKRNSLCADRWRRAAITRKSETQPGRHNRMSSALSFNGRVNAHMSTVRCKGLRGGSPPSVGDFYLASGEQPLRFKNFFVVAAKLPYGLAGRRCQYLDLVIEPR